jgi:hypothetical protein
MTHEAVLGGKVQGAELTVVNDFLARGLKR